MTDVTVPEQSGAQPSADANLTVESVLNQANTVEPNTEEAPQEAEPNEADKPEEQFPKKAVNALSRRDKQIGKLKAQNEHMMRELEQLRAGNASPKQEQQLVQDNKGVPTKLNQNDFKNYADFIEARAAEIAKHYIGQELSGFKDEQKATQQTANEQAWQTQRISEVDKQAEAFAKDHPEITAMFEEYSETIAEFPKELKHALLAADNAPLAFFNLAKDGKLEDLASMSLVDAKVEIRLAQMKEAAKPKTKAPAPIPAARGSVPASKPLEKLTAREAWNLLNPKD